MVLEKWKPKIMPHEPMVSGVERCRRHVLSALRGVVSRTLERRRSVGDERVCYTRYRPKPDEAELKKHIDGANVDGSVILCGNQIIRRVSTESLVVHAIDASLGRPADRSTEPRGHAMAPKATALKTRGSGTRCHAIIEPCRPAACCFLRLKVILTAGYRTLMNTRWRRATAYLS